MTQDEKEYMDLEVRPLRKPGGPDRPPKIRYCPCGFKWPSETSFQGEQLIKCPKYGNLISANYHTPIIKQVSLK